MISSLCEAYHWTVEEAFKLTTPQIILLCHASSEQYKRIKSKYPAKEYDYSTGTSNSDRLVDRTDLDPIIYKGKKLSEVANDSEMLVRYLSPLTNVNAM